MAVKLRLRREGSKKAPYYRVVAADARSPRDGRFIEILGYYQPTADPSRIELDGERALYWLRNGAQPTDAVQNLLRIVGVWEQFKPGDAPRRQRVQPERAEARTRATPQAQSTGGDTSPGAQAPEDVGEPPEAQTAAPAAETDTTQPTVEEGAS